MNDEDKKLFRRAVSDARPLRTEPKVDGRSKKPKPAARFSRADERAAVSESLEADLDELESSSGEHLRYCRPSVGRRTMRRLARGGYSVQSEIDLHGMTVDDAKLQLKEFVERCARDGKHCVRVVHGKGLGSGDRGPVLKRAVNSWLRRWEPVLAFVSTRQVDGGTGAVYVLLRSR